MLGKDSVRFVFLCRCLPNGAKEVSCSFRKYFESIAKSKETFVKETQEDRFDYIASVSAFSDKISD